MQAIKSLKSMFEPFAYPAFRAYMGGQAVSLIGTFLQTTAQSLLVYKISGGQATALGMVALCTALPMIVMSPFAGALVDRLHKRPLLIATQLAEMLLAFCLAGIAMAQLQTLAYVYILAGCLGACEALYFPAHQSYLAALGGPGRVRSALGLNSLVINFCRIIGPALAGLMVAHVGIAWSFWLNGLSFLAVVASVLRVKGAEPALSPAGSSGSLQVFAVFPAIMRQPQLRRLYLCVILINTFGQSVYTLIPALVHGDAEATGWLLACAGGGSFVSALLFLPLLNELKKPGLGLAGLLIWMGVCLIPAALVKSFGVQALCFFGAGMATSTLIPSVIGLVQITTPLGLRGRMIAVMTMVHVGLMPLASAVLGRVADLSTPPLTAAISAILLTASGLWLAAKRDWRQWVPEEA